MRHRLWWLHRPTALCFTRNSGHWFIIFTHGEMGWFQIFGQLISHVFDFLVVSLLLVLCPTWCTGEIVSITPEWNVTPDFIPIFEHIWFGVVGCYTMGIMVVWCLVHIPILSQWNCSPWGSDCRYSVFPLFFHSVIRTPNGSCWIGLVDYIVISEFEVG